MIPLIFLSAGGTAVDVLGLVQDLNGRGASYEPKGYLDDAVDLQGAIVHGLPVLGPLAEHRRFPDAAFVNCLGSPANYRRRGSIVEALGIDRERFATLVHPSAAVSRLSTIAAGTIVYPHVFIGSGVRIGRQALIMSHVSVNHGVVVDDYGILASGAIVLGKVAIGKSAYVGAGAAIHQNVSIGARALVGMGAIVRHDVGAGEVVVGVPSRRLRTTDD